MALVDTTLQTALISIFETMKTMTSGGDEYMATEMARAINSFILTASVSTVDTGVVPDIYTPNGVYAGTGTGNPGSFVINSGKLQSDLYETFTAEESTDDEIAENLAMNIHTACIQSNSITTNTVGVLTPKEGTPVSPYSGSGKGSFSGNKMPLEEKLKETFAEMKTMTSGGDTLFATNLASAIGTYLRTGTVSITLNTPITGTGTGGVL